MSVLILCCYFVFSIRELLRSAVYLLITWCLFLISCCFYATRSVTVVSHNKFEWYNETVIAHLILYGFSWKFQFKSLNIPVNYWLYQGIVNTVFKNDILSLIYYFRVRVSPKLEHGFILIAVCYKTCKKKWIWHAILMHKLFYCLEPNKMI
jgi:hypothetical protein